MKPHIKRLTLVDIAIAGGAGAVIGAIFAIALDSHWAIGGLIGGLAVGIFYKPHQLAQQITLGLQELRKKSRRTKESIAKNCKDENTNLKEVTTVLTYILASLAVVLPLYHFFCTTFNISADLKFTAMEGLCGMAMVGTIALGVVLACFADAEQPSRASWALPTVRLLYIAIQSNREALKQFNINKISWVTYILLFPVTWLCAVLAHFTFPLLILDILITVILAFAKTARLAAISGAGAGAMAGKIIFANTSNVAVSICASMAVGALVGVLTYYSRITIERKLKAAMEALEESSATALAT